MIYKILAILFIFTCPLFSNDIFKKDFFPFISGNYQQFPVYFPKLDIDQIRSLDGCRLKYIAPTVKMNNKSSINLVAVDKVKNLIFYTVGDNDIDVYGNKPEDVHLNQPQAIKLNENGFMYVADTGNNRIIKFYFDGDLVYFDASKGCLSWSETGDASINSFNEPSGLCIKDDYVYIADKNNHRILKFNSQGAPSSFIGNKNFLSRDSLPELSYPIDVQINNDNNIIICMTNTVLLIDGKTGTVVTKYEKTDILSQFSSVALDKFDSIYIADYGKNRVLKFDKNLNYLTTLGDDNSPFYTIPNPNSIFIYKEYGIIGVSLPKSFKTFVIAPGIEIFPMQSKEFFLPANKIEIKYKLTSDAKISAYVLAPSSQLVRQIEKNVSHNSGTNILVWDGKNDMGQDVIDWNYKIILNAYSSLQLPVNVESSVSIQITQLPVIDFHAIVPFAVSANNPFVTLTYSVPKPGYITLQIIKSNNNSFNIVKTLLVNAVVNKGGNSIKWDGNDDNENTLTDGKYYFYGKLTAYNNYEGAYQTYSVGVDRNPIKITSFNSSYAFAPKSPNSNKNKMKISFKLNEPGFVTVKIKNKAEINIKTIADNQYFDTADSEYTLLWDGKDVEGNVIQEGEYHVEMKAIDVTGNSLDMNK